MRTNILIERSENMMNELLLPVTRFCKLCGIDRSQWYGFKKGTAGFSYQKEKQIREVLDRYGF